MGIDASINSTGIVICDYNPAGELNHLENEMFYMIVSHLTKKQSKEKSITILEYNKTDDKIKTLHNYIDVLQSIIYEHKPDVILIENVPYAHGSRSVVDLAILNGGIRTIAHCMHIPIYVVNVSTWKKEVLGNGAADKDFSVLNFKALHPQFSNYSTKEINDISDAFFIAMYIKTEDINYEKED